MCEVQTYTNWELLLIEDCGPDRSRQIIEEYIRRTGDRRIRLLTHPTNLGAARARNLGVNEAKDVTWLIWMRTICGYRRSWSGACFYEAAEGCFCVHRI